MPGSAQDDSQDDDFPLITGNPRGAGTDDNKDMLAKLNQIESMSSDDLNLTTPKKETIVSGDKLTSNGGQVEADHSKRKKFAVKIIRARDQEY